MSQSCQIEVPSKSVLTAWFVIDFNIVYYYHPPFVAYEIIGFDYNLKMANFEIV